MDLTALAGERAARPRSGLGLAITSAIATTHGGRAEASPVTPHGLRVTLTLPAAAPAAGTGAGSGR